MPRSIHTFKIIVVILLLFVGVTLLGCNKDESAPKTTPEPETVKTNEEYRQQAEKEITEDNADESLTTIEVEISGDTDEQ